MVDQPDGRIRLGGAAEALHEDREHPAAGGGVTPDAGGVEDLLGEVPAEEAPRGTVRGGADRFAGGVEERASRRGSGAVGEDGAVLDEGLVGDGVTGDEDKGAVGDFDGDERAVAGFEAAEDLLDFGYGLAQPYEVADERDGGRPRRQVLVVARREEGEQWFEKGGDAE